MVSDVARVAWVTGASRGLGRAVALRLAGEGSALLLTARSSDALDEVRAATIQAGAPDVAVVAGSVSDGEVVEAAAELAQRRWGRVDLLVNNAGVSPVLQPLVAMDEDVLGTVLDVNLGGVLRTSRAALRVLAPGGSIINVSSVHAVSGMAGLGAYSATKGAVEALTRTLALECAPNGIRVNAVAPGYIETDMTRELREHDAWRTRLLERIPLGRFGTPEEVSGVVSFLASPAAAYITGSTMTIDGGWTSQ